MGLLKKIGIGLLALIVLGMIFGGNSNKPGAPTSTDNSKSSTQATPVQKTLMSNSFESDYEDIYCDEDATALQKKTLFEEKFKGQYVNWTGEVSRVAESYGNYVLNVKHCPDTFTSDIRITMKKDQKDKLLKLPEGDEVTYIAKLTDFGEIMGLSANDGEIVSIQ
ncbi:MAG: hypothetical protein ABIF85_00980 [Nanoarchaeota archaeon]